jgi:POTRA domain, FtsQ-type
MTTPQKNSHADTIRQRRSSQTPKDRVRERSKPSSATRGLGTGTHSMGTGTRMGNIAGNPVKRRTNQTAKQAYTPASLILPGEPRPVSPTTLRKMKSGALNPAASREAKGSAFGMNAKATARGGVVSFPIPLKGNKSRPGNRMVKKPGRKGYDSVFSLGHTSVRAPSISLPRLGSRWASAALTLVLGLMVYTMWTANTFKVSAAVVTGNQRLQVDEVTQMLGVVGQPIFTVIPSKIEQNLRTAFPDLESVGVQVAFPNHIRVAVVERMPVLVWFQDGNTTWLDSKGISFTPRGDVSGLLQIAAAGAPPKLPLLAGTSTCGTCAGAPTSINDQAFISADMVQAILTLAPKIPTGSPMIYDPNYGMGWQDPGGWSVYFGQNTQDIPMKLTVYQSMLDTFAKQGIQPTLISVAYLDDPFYK